MPITYQDMLAKLGVGSAHPGGFATTLELLNDLHVEKHMQILDVGCGTGRTACHLYSTYQCGVIGIDHNPLMIEKATIRKQKTNTPVDFIQADALHLPFPAQTFEMIIMESVSIFLPLGQLLKECRRVLKPGGKIVDLEMSAQENAPREVIASAKKLYRAKQVPTFEQWKNYYLKNGFYAVELWRPKQIELLSMMQKDFSYPDHEQVISQDAMQDKQVQQVLHANMEYMNNHSKHLGYTGIIAVKPSD